LLRILPFQPCIVVTTQIGNPWRCLESGLYYDYWKYWWQYMSGSSGWRGCAPPFCRREQFSMFVPLLLETPKKTLVHCTKPKIFPRKKCFFATIGKTWNLIPRCQENAYYKCSTWIFNFPPDPARSFAPSAFGIGGCAPRCVCPIPEMLDPPL
jgi:hypothetical protein